MDEINCYALIITWLFCTSSKVKWKLVWLLLVATGHLPGSPCWETRWILLRQNCKAFQWHTTWKLWPTGKRVKKLKGTEGGRWEWMRSNNVRKGRVGERVFSYWASFRAFGHGGMQSIKVLQYSALYFLVLWAWQWWSCDSGLSSWVYPYFM